MGNLVCSGKGSGKSTLLGKEWSWKWWLQNYGGLFIDPNGTGIDHFLYQVLLHDHRYQLSPANWQRLLSKIRYVDFSGSHGSVVSWPLIYHYPGQDLYKAADPFLKLVRRLDPQLSNAPVQGLNPLEEIYEHAAMVLAAFDGQLQITELDSLLRGAKNKNKTWQQRFNQAVERYPEVAPATHYFQTEYANMPSADRKRISSSLLAKIRKFSLSPTQGAIFGASRPGIDWDEVIEKGQIVLADFRHVSEEDRPFMMLMLLLNFLSYIELKRGKGKHHKKAFLIVDELTEMTDQMGSSGETLFARDMNKLINRTARNSNLMVVLCLQEAWQVSDDVFASLRSCANVVQGVSSHLDSAIKSARELFPFHPWIIREQQPIYGGNPPEVIDYRAIPYSRPEWEYFVSQAIRDLKTFKFLVRGAQREGEFNAPIQGMSLEHLIPSLKVNEDKVAFLREKLALRDGRPIADLILEIQQRQQLIATSIQSGGVVQPVKPANGGPSNSGQQSVTLSQVFPDHD
jgi:hypothetical protein